MTAPRACATCGARLPPDVRWCLRCYAPVLQLTPRQRQLPGLADVEEPPPSVARSPLRYPDAAPPTYSRWRAGPTTFGPVGRIVITLIVAMWFPWDVITALNPLRLWYMLGYTMLAAYVLRHTWKRERVMVERPRDRGGVRARLDDRIPVLARSVDARILLGIVGAMVGVGTVLLWSSADRFARYSLTAIAVTAAVALALSWWTET